MLTHDVERPIHDDPVAHAVEQDLRDNGMIAKLPKWEYDLPPILCWEHDRVLRLGMTKITLHARSDHRQATMAVLVYCDTDADPEEQAPRLIVTALEGCAAEIRAYLAAREAAPCSGYI
jgi:hypothetical protein